MEHREGRQERNRHRQAPGRLSRYESVIPNPKARLLDQVREVMRLKHYSIHTERSYVDWIRRYVRFHHPRSREELSGAEAVRANRPARVPVVLTEGRSSRCCWPCRGPRSWSPSCSTAVACA